ncbi:MAG: hypothetical protein IKW67_02515 [Alphaproteobacteria bacterium]|nr:hypothetical protein [Alphaproteobacteria bacterium]
MATILERNKNVKAPKKTRAEHAEDALYREVWEEVNNEKTMRFIKKYSRTIIAVVLGIMIVATVFQIGIRAYRANKMATAVVYEEALASMDANALAGLAENTSGATSDLALFQSYLLDKNIAKLEKLASDGNTPDFRDLAKLHIVSIRGDEMTAVDVEKYLSDLNSESSPFMYNARLIIAQKYLSVGDAKNANKWLDKIINDKNAPASIVGTAQTLR